MSDHQAHGRVFGQEGGRATTWRADYGTGVTRKKATCATRDISNLTDVA